MQMRKFSYCLHWEDIHLKPKAHTETPISCKPVKSEEDRKHRSDNFKKHLHTDLQILFSRISAKRDVSKQVSFKECSALLIDIDPKEGYEIIAKNLQRFCDLDSASIHIVWEPLVQQKKLTAANSNLHIMGTTYFLQANQFVYYSIYLNPNFLANERDLIGAIAHELSHVYANHNRLIFVSSDTDRKELEYTEQMTDLLGIVLGMGELMFDENKEGEVFNTCYLTNEMIKSSYLRWRDEFLNVAAVSRIIVCDKCSQKLRVPVTAKRLKLKCPKCKHEFEYRSTLKK
jgi:hypothetical protein